MNGFRCAAVIARIALALCAFATAALAQEGQHAPQGNGPGASVTPMPAPGPLAWPGASRNMRAQAYFDSGLNLAWRSQHEEAARAFRTAASHDPGCVLCHWGEAWALGPKINAAMDADANAAALEAIGRARRLAPPQGSLAHGLVEAIAQRHSADPHASRAELDLSYANAMRDLRARFPHEPEVAALAADALVNLLPRHDRQARARHLEGPVSEAAALVEELLGLRETHPMFQAHVLPPAQPNPDHVGAIQLHIRLLEMSDRPERAAPFIRRLGTPSPASRS